MRTRIGRAAFGVAPLVALTACGPAGGGSAAAGATGAAAAADPAAGDWASQCAYNNSDATAQGVDVTLFDTNAASTWNLVHSGGRTSGISGLGDKAFWDNDNTLYVMSGADLIQVNGLSSEQACEALAKLVLGALH